ncbi:MAG: formylglycine-generating enzyme family protein [Myxococcota bacterium]|jgi:formylglycine-generating enzyme required for sulfatase activity|nr:formylglycine-generating enzyme family protein [Myxococcota bacterium]
MTFSRLRASILAFFCFGLCLLLAACDDDPVQQQDTLTETDEDLGELPLDQDATELDAIDEEQPPDLTEQLDEDAEQADDDGPDQDELDVVDQDELCTPDCSGRQCGEDGCGGVCGDFLQTDCEGDVLQSCEDGQVVSTNCALEGQLCVPSEAFGHVCRTPDCTPDCSGKACGDDGCGGVCGPFVSSDCFDGRLRQCEGGVIQVVDCVESGDICQEDGQGGHECACVPDCTDKQCGDDGCGGLCGGMGESACQDDVLITCEQGQLAFDDCTLLGGICEDDGSGGHQCTCTPDCEGKLCGDDGCGGSCGPDPSACDGTVLSYCNGGQVAQLDCASLDAFCSELVSSPGHFECGPAAMIRIPNSGAQTSFSLGCPSVADGWGELDAPSRDTTLDAFYIDRYEVTTAEYSSCVAAAQCSPAATGSEYNYGRVDRASHPINGVTWTQAKEYCEWAGKRLPTEAEWERAAKGPTHRRFPWGDNCPSSWNWRCSGLEWGPSIAKANASEGASFDGFTLTAPVGSFILSTNNGRSPEGLGDMAGNVYEWCSDWYASYPAGSLNNPSGPSSGSERVLRGGAWASSGAALRTSYRGALSPSTVDPIIGFRCAKSVD